MFQINDYECTECHNVEEVFRRRDAEGDVECKQCGGRMEKVLSAPKVVSMGSEAQALKGITGILKKEQTKPYYFNT